MTTTVRDNPDENRYEIHVDGELAGFAGYKLGPDRISLLHTEVKDEFGGRGLARELVTEAFADARRRGLGVLPFCPYVRGVIAKDPAQYLDLVPAGERARFDLPADTTSGAADTGG